MVEDQDLCPRITARVLTGSWSARRPAGWPAASPWPGCGPINNVVDASNYVMLELGQPTHPYDLDRVGGSGLRVRRARPGETVVTLDGVERILGHARASGLGDDRRGLRDL